MQSNIRSRACARFRIRQAGPVLLAGLLWVLGGCYLQLTKDEKPLPPARIEGIVVGETTKAEILERLGAPTRIVKLLDSEAFMYEHSREKRSGLFAVLLITHRVDKQSDAITVIVDRDGIVRGVGSRFTAEEASFGTPWGE